MLHVPRIMLVLDFCNSLFLCGTFVSFSGWVKRNHGANFNKCTFEFPQQIPFSVMYVVRVQQYSARTYCPWSFIIHTWSKSGFLCFKTCSNWLIRSSSLFYFIVKTITVCKYPIQLNTRKICFTAAIILDPGSCQQQMGPTLAPWTLLWRNVTTVQH